MTRPVRTDRLLMDRKPAFRMYWLAMALCVAGSASAQSNLTYENWAQGFFTLSCLGCHHSSQHGEDRFGAPAGVNFDTLELIRQNETAIRDMALGDEPAMPPAGVVWWWDRVSLKEWLDAGMPGNADSLHPVVLNPKTKGLDYWAGGLYFSNPIEDVFEHRYISFLPDHEDEFEGFITERSVEITRLVDGTVVMNSREWFHRTHDWSDTDTRLIEYTPPIPLLMHGPGSTGETWEQTVTARERFWDGWWGGQPERDQTRQETWRVVNAGLEIVDNGVIRPEEALKVVQSNLTSGETFTYWFAQGLGLIRRETNAASSIAGYVREITREMNVVTVEYPLYGPHIVEEASQEWLPFIGRWYSPEYENYDYWNEMEVQRVGVLDESQGPAPTPTVTLALDPTNTPVEPTPSFTPFPPGLPPVQPTRTPTASATRTSSPTDAPPDPSATPTWTQIPPTSSATPSHSPTDSPTSTHSPLPSPTDTIPGALPTPTPTSTGPLAASPTPTETFDISDPRLSDYNKDNVIDLLDLLMFLEHWHAEMEPAQTE